VQGVAEIGQPFDSRFQFPVQSEFHREIPAPTRCFRNSELITRKVFKQTVIKKQGGGVGVLVEGQIENEPSK
jgi:hypothetical protein